jgi:hypothetical protein
MSKRKKMTFREAKYLRVPHGVDLLAVMEERRDRTGYNGGFDITFVDDEPADTATRGERARTTG